MQHLQLQLQGFLQGVGLRPFVYQLAQKYQQTGWVANTSDGVLIHIQGKQNLQTLFLHDLQQQLPPSALIKSQQSQQLPLENFKQFSIVKSQLNNPPSVFVLPDIATCTACTTELFEPSSRYYQYPFISCCHCGPRYSIMQSQPYDRQRTSMAAYPLCSDCQQDYQDPSNRRFHAQTIACAKCGPSLSFLDRQGNELSHKSNALADCIQQLQAGKIVAVKGLGGYQLLVNAADDQAVARLRRKKNRLVKPFALLASNLAMVEKFCQFNQQECLTLESAMAPIVLLKKRANLELSAQVAPDCALLGMMLPSSGLQHLIMREFSQPLIATSANRSGEPICIDQQQALTCLAGIADYYLTHERAILRPLDDSIVRVIANEPRVFRRARGYVPLPIALEAKDKQLALGGHLKSTWAFSYQGYALLSQYLGDLNSAATQAIFQQSINDAQAFYQIQAQALVHDQHPDYFSSRYAQASSLSSTTVQHHHAHAFSCMAEHQLKPPVLAITWDGMGLGSDHSNWGGEFFLIQENTLQRFAHFQPLPLLGGDKANQEPRRMAIAVLYQLFGEHWREYAAELDCLHEFTEQQQLVLNAALKHQLNTPLTSSVGRLFDALASLLGLCQINQYEGQAASLLEAQTDLAKHQGIYTYQCLVGTASNTAIQIDWRPMFLEILEDLKLQTVPIIALKFHHTLADITLKIAQRAAEPVVVLSGGCFQNAYLTEIVQQVLSEAGFQVYSQQQVPTNDSGLALGQLYYQFLANK